MASSLPFGEMDTERICCAGEECVESGDFGPRRRSTEAAERDDQHAANQMSSPHLPSR